MVATVLLVAALLAETVVAQPVYWSQFLQNNFTSQDVVAKDSFGSIVAVAGTTVFVGSPDKAFGGRTGQGAVYVFSCSSGLTSCVQTFEIILVSGAQGDEFGSAIAVTSDGSLLFIGRPGATTGGEVRLYSCPSPFSCSAKATLKSSQSFDGDEFGSSIALFQPYGTVLIGAYNADVGSNSSQGLVYMFSCSGTSCAEAAHFGADNGAGLDQFGQTCAVSGSLAVVAAPNKQINGQPSVGAVYVFNCQGTSCSQIAFLIPSPVYLNVNYGNSVAISGSIVAVGAARQQVGARDSQGAVFVYSCTTSACTFGMQLTSQGRGKFFGWSVAMAQNVLIVGAIGEATCGFAQGAAIVYVCESATSCTPTTSLTPSTGAARIDMGYSVAVGGSVVVVGAAAQSSSDGQVGQVFVFATDATTGVVTCQDGFAGPNCNACSAGITCPLAVCSVTTHFSDRRMYPTDVKQNLYYGTSLSTAGSIAVIGVPSTSVNGYPGTAVVYQCISMTCTFGIELIASDGVVGDGFGSSVAVGAGGTYVAVGAPNSGTLGRGAAYVHYCNNFATCFVISKLLASDGSAGDSFGSKIAISGSAIIVAAPYNSQQGAVYVYTCTLSSCAQLQKLVASDAAPSDYFGISFAVFGNNIIIGAPQKTLQLSHQGAAYVFSCSTFSTASCTQQIELTLPAGTVAASDGFGQAVALSDSLVVVGAPSKTIGGDAYRGAVYVYSCSTPSTCTLSSQLSALDASSYSDFGSTLVLSGSTLYVGTYAAIANNIAQGSMYAFDCTLPAACVQNSKVTASDGLANEDFASAIAPMGNLLLISTSMSTDINGTLPNVGSVYLFSCNSTGFCQCDPGWVGINCDNCIDQSCMTVVQLSCGHGTYANGSQCLNCTMPCGNCYGSATNCTSCPANGPVYLMAGTCVGSCSGQIPFADNTTCVSQCPANKYADASNRCQLCSGACSGCIGSDSICTGCTGDLFLSSGNCLSASGCPIGTFPNVNNFRCDQCIDANCAICASGSPHSCNVCLAPYALYGGQCTTLCPPGTFSNGTICQDCAAGCTECTGSALAACTACDSSQGLYLSANRCVAASSCPTNTFPNQNQGICQTCDSSCNTCAGNATSCTSCPGMLLNLYLGQCLITCPAGTLPAAANGQNICQVQIATSLFYYSPRWYTDTTLLAIQLQIFNLASSPLLMARLPLARCPSAPLFYVDIPATDTQADALGFIVVAFNSSTSELIDWANCTTGSYYTGISLSSRTNAILSANSCAGTVAAHYDFTLNNKVVSCQPTICAGYSDNATFSVWSDSLVASKPVNGTCFPGYGGSPTQLCTSAGWTNQQGQCVQCPAHCVTCSLSTAAQLLCSVCEQYYDVSNGSCVRSNTNDVYILLGAVGVLAVIAIVACAFVYRKRRSGALKKTFYWTVLLRLPVFALAVFDTFSDVLFVLVISETTGANTFLIAAVVFTMVPYAINFLVAAAAFIPRLFKRTNDADGNDKTANLFIIAPVVLVLFSGDVIGATTLTQSLRSLHKELLVDDIRVEAYRLAFKTSDFYAAIGLYGIQLFLKDLPHLIIQAVFLSSQNQTNIIVLLALTASGLTAVLGVLSFLAFTLAPLRRRRIQQQTDNPSDNRVSSPIHSVEMENY